MTYTSRLDPRRDFEGGDFDPDQLLIVGTGGGEQLHAHRNSVAAFLKGGGQVLALGLDAADTGAFEPFGVTFSSTEHISACFDPPAIGSPLAGIGPADVHCRDPRVIPLVSGGARI